MKHCPHCGGDIEDIPEDNCLFCGKVYKKAREWSKFCRPLCQSRWHYARRLKKERELEGEQG